MIINGYDLKMTCSACPEQYDVFKNGEQVGYLRLRHGEFTAEVPNCGGETVLETEEMNGEGIFDDDERTEYLTMAIDAVDKYLKETKK